MRESTTGPRRVRILGVPVDCLTRQSAIEAATILLERGATGTVVAVNPEKVMKARRDAELRRFLAESALLLPDGIGVVWAARFLYGVRLERVPGADFMPVLCELAERDGYRVFLFGGRPETVELASRELKRRFPRLNLAGYQDGYLDAVRVHELVDLIAQLKVDILFVALGSPKQEEWMRQHLRDTGVKLCQGVGGTFDVLAGRVKRAPGFWVKLNLEWAYRLISEPSRIKRQIALPVFAWKVLMQKLRMDG